jgi:hypothetical protein
LLEVLRDLAIAFMIMMNHAGRAFFTGAIAGCKLGPHSNTSLATPAY